MTGYDNSNKGALLSLNISNNELTRGKYVSGHYNFDSSYETDMTGASSAKLTKAHFHVFAGVIALADGIKNNGALETITFGDRQAVTMNTSMSEADFSGKHLYISGAIIVAAFLPKCQ